METMLFEVQGSLTQTRPVWDCQHGLPRNGQGWWCQSYGSPTEPLGYVGFGGRVKILKIPPAT